MSVFQSQFQAPQIVKELRNWSPYTGRCNILLFGLSGAGKSSLINTLASNKEMVTRAAKVRFDSIGMLTETFNKYTFKDTEDSSVRIFDTWGVFFGEKDVNYPESTFMRILKGSLQENHNRFDEIYEKEVQDNNRIIDAVVFVEASDVKHRPHCLLQMRKFYDLAREKGLPVFYAVTKIDYFFQEIEERNILTESDEKQAATHVHQSQSWKELQQCIRTNIKDPQAVVLPVINYTQHDTFANHVINFFAQEFVKVLTSRIDEFYKQKNRCFCCPYGNHIATNKMKWSARYFQNEKVNKLNYEENRVALSLAVPDIDKSQGQESHNHYHNDVGKYVVLDSFYTLLLLGRMKWRFFLVVLRSENLQVRTICGLYDPDEDVYFGSEEKNNNDHLTRKTLEQSFGGKFVGSYSYLSGINGKESLDSFHSNLTQYVKLSLRKHHHLILSNKKWEPLHSIILNYISKRKEREEVQRDLEEKILFTQERVKKLEQGAKILNRSMKKLSEFVIQQQYQQRQYGGQQARIMENRNT